MVKTLVDDWINASLLGMQKTLVDDWIDTSWLGMMKTLVDDGMDASWLGMIKTSVDDWIDSAVAHLLDVLIFSTDFWRGLPSLKGWTSLSKIPTNSSVTREVRALVMI